MTNSSKLKGDAAEREAAQLIAELTGHPARRKLGAGRADDTGDYRNARLHLERAQQRALHAQRSMRATIARWNGYEHEHG